MLKKLQNQANSSMKHEEKPEWFAKISEMTDFTDCDEENRFNYRNKAEFTIGTN